MTPARRGSTSGPGKPSRPGKADKASHRAKPPRPPKAPRPGKESRDGRRGPEAGSPGLVVGDQRTGTGKPRRSGDRPLERAEPRRDRGLGGEQVEGRQAVRELLLAGRRRVREVLLAQATEPSATHHGASREAIGDIAELAAQLRVPVRIVARGKLDASARTESHQGVLARADPLPEAELDELTETRRGLAPFLIALDGVTDPGNLGALLRSAECAGVTGVLLPRHRAVHVTPAVTKAAAGAVEYLPMAIVGGLPATLVRLAERGIWTVGLDASGVPFDQVALAGEPVALVLGAEGTGLSRLVRQRCDVVASLPLRGQLGSLNVAAAGAVACYEIARRRPGSGRPQGQR